MDNVQILCRAAAVRLAIAGLPPWQQRCCYAVCTCTITEVEVRVVCREALSVTSHPYSRGKARPIISIGLPVPHGPSMDMQRHGAHCIIQTGFHRALQSAHATELADIGRASQTGSLPAFPLYRLTAAAAAEDPGMTPLRRPMWRTLPTAPRRAALGGACPLLAACCAAARCGGATVPDAPADKQLSHLSTTGMPPNNLSLRTPFQIERHPLGRVEHKDTGTLQGRAI